MTEPQMESSVRPICEICGQSSSPGSSLCASCGVAFPKADASAPVVKDRIALGADQSPRMQATLREFLATGKFGAVTIGMTKAEVLSAAGMPAEFHRGETLDDSEVWINGRVTFWFDGDRLDRIGIYFILEYLSNQAIQYDADFPARGPELCALKDFMEAAGISFRAESTSIITAGGVELNANPASSVHSMVVPPLPIRRGRSAHRTTR
jgi:hypothetical protein